MLEVSVVCQGAVGVKRAAVQILRVVLIVEVIEECTNTARAQSSTAAEREAFLEADADLAAT